MNRPSGADFVLLNGCSSRGHTSARVHFAFINERKLGSCGSRRTFPLETFAAEHRASLGGLEGDGGLLAASRAGGARLYLLVEVAGTAGLVAHGRSALPFAVLATLGFVLELFVV